MKRILCLALLLPQLVLAATEDSLQRLSLHFQTTYIYQYKPAFHASYSGPHSLSKEEERQNSLTATLYLGLRLWQGAAIYINPELAGGSGLSGASGMGASTNGETFRVGNPAPTLYLARAYMTQTFAIGHSGIEWQEDDANQVGVYQPRHYLQLIAGKSSLADIFDNNTCSNSPRSQLINWGLMNNGAWDFAANVRGYTYMLGGVLHYGPMSYRLAAAALPKEANGDELDTDPGRALSLNGELGWHFRCNKQEGNIRVLGFYNRAPMGSYAKAISLSPFQPDVISTRAGSRGKTGFGLNGDYSLNRYYSLFARLGWNDGRNETWCFTEIDHSASLGLNADGSRWHRDEDHAGIGLVMSGLSGIHRDYLKRGGNGFVLGDGYLRYAPESVLELYYDSRLSAKVPVYVGGDYQFCMHPGYNRDRGPVHVCSVRVHVAF